MSGTTKNEKNTEKFKERIYSDGISTISDLENNSREEEELEKEPEISDKSLKKLLQFSMGIKNPTKEELDEVRNDDVMLEKISKIATIKMKHFNYNPKKTFGAKYKAKRKIKNKMTRTSRRANK